MVLNVSKRKTMSKIELIVDTPEIDNWGQFGLRKTFQVTPPANGYIIQEVVKKTTATTSDGKTYSTTTEINDLTNGNVLNASDTYYELFPIIQGTTCKGVPKRDRSNCIDDQFQNGAILRYVPDDKEWVADDEPATMGTITMIGTNVFIETSKEEAEALYDMINENKGGTFKDKTGNTWNLSPRTPANGLPYATSLIPVFSTLTKNKPIVVHNVVVRWKATGATTVTSSQSLVGGRRRRLTRGRTASKLRYKRRIGRTRRR